MAPRREISHVCDECGRTFRCSGHLTRHKLTHTGERPYQCDHPGCHSSYTRAENLRRHQLSHTNTKPFGCKTCNKHFTTKQRLHRHEALHQLATPFKCPDCGHSFRKKNMLAKHRAVHTGKMPHPCREPGCELSFPTPAKLQRHVLKEHVGRKYVCSEGDCLGKEVVFGKFSEFTKHLAAVHPMEHRCVECDRHFASATALRNHVRTHTLSLVDRMVYVCDVPGCEARYTSSGSLSNHVRAKHTEKDSFVCHLCERTFSFMSVLRGHLQKVHNGELPRMEEIRMRHPGVGGMGGKKREKISSQPSHTESSSSTITTRKRVRVAAQTDIEEHQVMPDTLVENLQLQNATLTNEPKSTDSANDRNESKQASEEQPSPNEVTSTETRLAPCVVPAPPLEDELAPVAVAALTLEEPPSSPTCRAALAQSAEDKRSCDFMLAAAAAAAGSSTATEFNAQGFRVVSAK